MKKWKQLLIEKFGENYNEKIENLGLYTKDEVETMLKNIKHVLNNVGDYIIDANYEKWFKKMLDEVYNYINDDMERYGRVNNGYNFIDQFYYPDPDQPFHLSDSEKDGLYIVLYDAVYKRVGDYCLYIPSDRLLSE